MKNLLLTLAIISAFVNASNAGEICGKTSPPHTVALLELYTSEGCDSCPPADKTVRHLQDLTGLSTEQLIPIALHVNYWDYIGWKDPYAQIFHAERQRDLAQHSRARGVYTPEFFINGQELPNWRGDLIKYTKNINLQPARASLHLGITQVSENILLIKTESVSQQADELHLVLLENGLVSQVKAGENKGSTLQHDAVARNWSNSIKLTAGSPHHETFQLAIPPQAVKSNLSVVGFIQNQNGAILQSLLLPVCKTQI
ncbi:DUF1223 domain-containing protein [Undibacterium sp. SXout20W]|uniref:DUF1223 domain-containing protein n=1 Tax=Undibacterium sp. SXout20W TaxID=3413051 RepID=UPI003BEF8277